MARDKATLTNIDNQSPANYPNGRIKDNDGSGNGTPVNERVYGDFHEFFAKLMRLGAISYNGLPDNEINGYQLLSALESFPTKNDVLYDIGTISGRLTIGIKVGILKSNEILRGRAIVNFGSQTQIRGTDNTNKNITVQGNFLAGDYLLLINEASSIRIVRDANHVSLNSMITTLSFLKAASTSQELAGLLNTVATTPQSNLLAFVERVNGASSASSLANALRNGLYPKEHWNIVENLGSDRVRNIGWFDGYNVNSGSTNQTYVRSGDVNTARRTAKSGDMDTLEITVANEMNGLNYYVRAFVESRGNAQQDNDIKPITFRPVSSTVFNLFCEESPDNNSNLKIHLEVVQIG
ncbi:MAG: hypothetical protein AAGH46_06500 [Bacteroidota bacterium]